MLSTANNLLNDLDEQLRFLNLEMDDSINAAETAISIILKSLEKLKAHTLKYNFKNQLEEIYFFKKVKPLFLSKLIYYNRIYIIKKYKPHGGEKVLRVFHNPYCTPYLYYYSNPHKRCAYWKRKQNVRS